EAAQQRRLLAFGIFGDKALRGRTEAKVADAADQQQPGPGIDVNAELVAAEPAGEHDLRQEGEQRRGDAKEKGSAGQTAHQRQVAGAGEQRQAAPDGALNVNKPGDAPATRRLLGTNRCHNNPYAAGATGGTGDGASLATKR